MWPLWLLVLAACGDTLPADIAAYQSECIKMNSESIPPYDGDPHEGFKDVYACNIEQGLLEGDTRPFPEGTIIVKESTRGGEDAPWLVATARKGQGEGANSWQWDEYTRNFADEEYRRILASQSTCTDCHRRAADSDYIFTFYDAP